MNEVDNMKAVRHQKIAAETFDINNFKMRFIDSMPTDQVFLAPDSLTAQAFQSRNVRGDFKRLQLAALNGDREASEIFDVSTPAFGLVMPSSLYIAE